MRLFYITGQVHRTLYAPLFRRIPATSKAAEEGRLKQISPEISDAFLFAGFFTI